MALTSCRECGKGVSTQAATCPHCGMREPSRTAHANRAGRAILSTIIILGGMYACSHMISQESSTPHVESASSKALRLCQYAIKRMAKNPSSANIPWAADHVTSQGHSFDWPLGSGLTMMNGFGAQLDTSASCQTSADGAHLVSLELDGKRVL